MKPKTLLLSLALLLLLATSCTVDKTASKPQFHPPQTAAEKALAHILMLDHTDRYFRSFVFKALERNKSKDKDYANLFTKALEDAWEKAYLSIPPEDDSGGRYVPMDWIVCGQETSEEYFYSTVRSGKYESYIAVVTPEAVNISPSLIPYPFRMIEENGAWKLDGVRCPDGFNFNTDFNYTR
jgi:hypothetical protein